MAVRFKGPLFDNPGAAIRKGVRPGLSELGTRIEATVSLHTPRDKGTAKRAIQMVIWRDNRGVSVKSNLPKLTRKTWLERGTRRGVNNNRKIGPAYYMWRKGKAKAREINKQALMAADIARELNGR